ncbi:hypothetical protein RYX36_033904 [Vicia faba]
MSRFLSFSPITALISALDPAPILFQFAFSVMFSTYPCRSILYSSPSSRSRSASVAPVLIIHHCSQSSIVVLRPKAPPSVILLLERLTKSGIIVGNGLNTKKGFDVRIASTVAEETHLPFVTAENKFEALTWIAHVGFTENLTFDNI